MIKNLINAFWSIIFLLFLVSCFNNSGDNKKDSPVLIAKAFENSLYSSDLQGIIPMSVSKEDSIVKATNYIDYWIKRQLILKRAEQNLPPEEKDVNKQLEDYRAALLIYKYKQRFVEQKLDTIISPQEVEDYYISHANDFKLKQSIVKAEYFKLGSTTQESYKLKWWIWYDFEKNKDKIDLFCQQQGAGRDNFNNQWLYFTNLAHYIPLKTDDEDGFLKKNKVYEAKDSLNFYYLIINDYKLKNDTTPLFFVSNDIRNILINKKKMNLIRKLEEDIYRDAFNKGEIQIFVK